MWGVPATTEDSLSMVNDQTTLVSREALEVIALRLQAQISPHNFRKITGGPVGDRVLSD